MNSHIGLPTLEIKYCQQLSVDLNLNTVVEILRTLEILRKILSTSAMFQMELEVSKGKFCKNFVPIIALLPAVHRYLGSKASIICCSPCIVSAKENMAQLKTTKES